MRLRYSNIVLLLLLAPALTLAEVYKWTDENGEVHYSDKPLDKNTKKFRYNPSVIGQDSFKKKVRKNPGIFRPTLSIWIFKDKKNIKHIAKNSLKNRSATVMKPGRI